MNGPSSDSELQSILREARENYQKRIQSLKHSMQGIIKDLPTDRANITERPEYSKKKFQDEELLQSLSKVQVLQIENQNLKSILQKENFENSSPAKKTHKRFSSCKNDPLRELNGLKELVNLYERENKELRSMIEGLKINCEELEIDNKEKFKELNEEIRFLMRKNREFEESSERLIGEIEKLKKEKSQLMSKAQRFEDKSKGLQSEINALENEISRLRQNKEPQNANFFKYKSKTRALKEKLAELTEKSDKNFRVLVEKEGKVMELGQELRNTMEKVVDKESCIDQLESEMEHLRKQLGEMTMKLSEYEKDLNTLRASQSTEKLLAQQAQNELISTYESKISAMQKESSEKSAKSAQDILTQLDQIEQDYKFQLEQKSETISSLTQRNTALSKSIKELQLTIAELSNKSQTLEQEFIQKQEEFKQIFNKEIAQHKSDVLSLETELNNLYETKSQSSTDVEILIEKYKVLKNEYFSLQQNYQVNRNVYEQQIEELKQSCAVKEKEILFFKGKEEEFRRDSNEKAEKVKKEFRVCEDEKAKFRAEMGNYKEKLSLECRKMQRLKDLVKVSFKQMKNEFFTIAKQAHRGVFEELLMMKKFISEFNQVLQNKLNFSFHSWASLLNSQSLSKKHLQEHFHRESEDLNTIKLHLSQLERELQIKDDRILYLESSLKNSLSRTRSNDPELLKTILKQLNMLETSYTNDYQELVDLIITLKAIMSKEHMENMNDLISRSHHKDILLKQARNELIKYINV